MDPVTTTNDLEPDSIPPTDLVWFFEYEEYVAEVASPPDSTSLPPVTSPESDVMFEAWAMEEEIAYLRYLNSLGFIDPAPSDDLSDEGASHLEDFIVPFAETVSTWGQIHFLVPLPHKRRNRRVAATESMKDPWIPFTKANRNSRTKKWI